MRKSLLTLLSIALIGLLASCANKKLTKQEKNDLKSTYEALLKELPDAQVTLDGDRVKVVFGEGILFAVNSDKINKGYIPNLAKMSEILNRYPKTNILISGHTDNTGTLEINESLSKRRADAAKNVLVENGVASSRIYTWGLADRDPVADNSTEAGRAKNRRVEFVVMYHYNARKDDLDIKLKKKKK